DKGGGGGSAGSTGAAASGSDRREQAGCRARTATKEEGARPETPFTPRALPQPHREA
ncbi:hypothetical protein NDU88_007418, partial [Pleurodeles waltl]